MHYRVKGGSSYAGIALPSGPPRGLIVVAHGAGSFPDLRGFDGADLSRLAQLSGAIVAEPDYRGTRDPGVGGNTKKFARGTPLKAGAEDVDALGRWFDDHCKLPTRVLISFSMGSAVAGLALATGPKRANGRPLFDLWSSSSGLYDVFEQQSFQFVPGQVVPGAAQALADYEAEAGGSPVTSPGRFMALSPVYHAHEIAHAGLAAAVLVHAVAESVLVDSAVRMAAGLSAAGQPTRLVLATTANATKQPLCRAAHSAPSPGTTLVTMATGGLGPLDVLAGHVGDATYCRAQDVALDWIAGRSVPNGTSLQVAEDRFLRSNALAVRANMARVPVDLGCLTDLEPCERLGERRARVG